MVLFDMFVVLYGECLYVYVLEEGLCNDFCVLFVQLVDDMYIYVCGFVWMFDVFEVSCVYWLCDVLCVEYFVLMCVVFDLLNECLFEVELRDFGIMLMVVVNQMVFDVLQYVNIDVQSDCCEGLCGLCEVWVLVGCVDYCDSVLMCVECDVYDCMMICCLCVCGGEWFVFEF